jgi:DNA-binding MarR family transcriptional regulator
MAAQRLSRLHKRILQWLAADSQRTQGTTTSSHQELVEALAGDKSNISRSLRTLEKRGWMVIHRTSGGKAESLYLTSEGLQRASEI